MKIMRKMLSLLLALLLLASLLAGCGKKEEDAQPFVLRVSTCGALETLDPATMVPVAAAISRVENGTAADPDEIRRGWELFTT